MKLAFSSALIINSLKKFSINIPSIEDTLTNLRVKKYKEVIFLTTHLLPGNEYDIIKQNIMLFQNDNNTISFDIKLTQPLLSEVEYINLIVNRLKKEYDYIDNKTAVLFIGHGSDHKNNAIYHKVNQELQMTTNNLFLATLKDFNKVDSSVNQKAEFSQVNLILTLRNQKITNVILAPFMLVSGSHAKKDMIGDFQNSWKSFLEKHGFHVTYHLKGLGEYEFIDNILIKELNSNINTESFH